MQIISVDNILESAKVLVIPVLEGESIPLFVHDDFPVEVFSGKKNTRHVHIKDELTFLLIGLGTMPSHATIVNAYRSVFHFHNELCQKEMTLWFPNNVEKEIVQAAFQGLLLGTYRLGSFKTENTNRNILPGEVFFLGSNDLLKFAQLGFAVARAQMITMNWVDLPPNILTPQKWANDVVELFQAKENFSVEIFDEIKANNLGLEAFLSVGRGSSKSPRFILVDYSPPFYEAHIGLVGKGITFDTGGLNIKTQGMVHMKCDMGGGAAVLGTMQLLGELNLPIRVTTIVPACENAINSNAFLPSDVISSYSGKTIEIIDTDAEGRLILADGLSYLLKNYKPDVVIDVATLTGSSVATFGYECGALFTKNENISKQLVDAGIKVGEKLWPLPLWDEYRSDIESEIADVKNYSGKPIAGAITAAKFLEYFTEEHTAWAHLDIAGVAFGDDAFAKTKHATAFGVQLLTNFIENYTHGK